MKKYFFLLFLIIPGLVSAAMPTLRSSGIVQSVTDGDTIKVRIWTWVETIRILGLDAPESFTTRFGYVECYGKESSNYLKNLLSSGSSVYVEFYGNDKYSRDLADVYIWSRTWTLIAKSIIQNGYGWVYTKGVKTKNYASLLRSQNLAKKSKVGLWSTTTCGGKRKEVTTQTGTISSSATTQNSSVVPKTGIYSCTNVPKYCTGVKTREEAQYYLNSCGATRFDADHDGIACEAIK